MSVKYKVDATVRIVLEDVKLDLDDHINEELELEDALLQKLNKQLTLLDIKGARTGDEGVITSMECDDIDNWSTE